MWGKSKIVFRRTEVKARIRDNKGEGYRAHQRGKDSGVPSLMYIIFYIIFVILAVLNTSVMI